MNIASCITDKPIEKNDEDKLKIRGILGLKDKKKRPLVIIRNGVYGNASETAVSKNLIMQLFDERTKISATFTSS